MERRDPQLKFRSKQVLKATIEVKNSKTMSGTSILEIFSRYLYLILLILNL